MAVTSIWPIKNNRQLATVKKVIDYARNPEKTVERDPEKLVPLHAIDGVIQYTANDMKTEIRAYVKVLNCQSEETAAQEFMETKTLWGKTDGRLCFHGYQSFAADEVNAETAHEIGVKLAERLWGKEFQVVVATHCNTGHYHNHFVLNSVSCLDGHHFDNTPADYRAMREASDELCREYGLSVIDEPVGKRKTYAELRAEQNGQVPFRVSIKNDIDRAIAASFTDTEFFRYLSSIGYEFNFYREDGITPLKYPGLRPPDAKNFFRFHKLGQGYSLDNINDRILQKRIRLSPFPEEERDAVQSYRQNNPPPHYEKKKSHLYRIYLRYCYELHIIEKHPASVQRVSFFVREDMAHLDKLDAQTRLLAKHKLSTYEDVAAHKGDLFLQIKALEAKRSGLRNEMRCLKRGLSFTTADAVKEQITDITKQLRELRKEVSLCDDILIRSAKTQDELDWILTQQEILRKEEPDYELFGRCSRASRADELGRS